MIDLNAYSIFGIAVDRKHEPKWLFHQGKATFHCSQKVYVYSENALTSSAFSLGLNQCLQQRELCQFE
jgi:hypothetical protein